MASRLLQFNRFFSQSRTVRSSLSEPLQAQTLAHHGKTELWKKLFIYVCCPCVALVWLNVVFGEPDKVPEFKKYPYLRIRRNKFPWKDGIKTLFHNPETNALPDGFEKHE